MNFIDLFGGVGGFRLGMESGKHKCVWYNDIDKYCVDVYNKGFDEVNEPKDIREVDERTIPKHDCICAGFPCQSFSIAGKRKGLSDTRGTLFFEICRIAKFHRPKMLFLENVRGLLSHDKGETFRIILKSLWDLGYGIEWQVLNSKDFSVPQHRRRVFLIGHLGGLSGQQIFPIEGIVKEFDRSREETERIPMRWKRTEKGKEMRRKSQKAGKDNTPFTGNCRELVQSEEDISGCITGAMNKDTFISERGKIRRLTPIECERLQGFEDNWTQYGMNGKISDSQRYKMLGNAVTVNVIEAIVERLK